MVAVAIALLLPVHLSVRPEAQRKGRQSEQPVVVVVVELVVVVVAVVVGLIVALLVEVRLVLVSHIAIVVVTDSTRGELDQADFAL